MASGSRKEDTLGGLGDILSMALEQTGFELDTSMGLNLLDTNALLNVGGSCTDDPLLSMDISSLTQGLFSGLSSATLAATSLSSVMSVPTPSSIAQTTLTFSQQAGIQFSKEPPVSVEAEPMKTGIDSMELDLDGINLNELIAQDPPVELLPKNPTAAVVTSLSEIQIFARNSLITAVPKLGELLPHVSITAAAPSVGEGTAPALSQPLMVASQQLDSTDDLSALLDSTGSEYLDSISSVVKNEPSTPLVAKAATRLGTIEELSFPRPALILKQGSNGGGVVVSQLPTAGKSFVSGSNVFIVGAMMDKVTVATAAAAVAAAAAVGTPLPPLPVEEDLEEEEEFVTVDTYANYKPAKLRIGRMHPDPIVESSSLSSVEPPQVWFDVKLPQHVIDEGRLSSLQLEAVVYSSQQHMNILADGSRAGFLVGDGAGVGKGRTIAGIIFQNYLEGRKKALWLSVSNDLKYDAMRDLQDVGAKKIKVYALNKFHYGKISGKRNGRVKKGVIFATYSSLIGESSSGGKYRTRLNQLLHWLGVHFEGVIVFDECHKAKNLVPTGSSKPSKTGMTVLQLQKKLPKARIVYCSATGASEPRNMAYMSRLGIWGTGTQFPTFQDFIKAVERRGVGAMEIVAMDMKLRGVYTARQLSFAGVTFDVKEVPVQDDYITMYDMSVELWVEARRLFQEAADLLDYDRKKLKTMWGQFWASHQRFFKYLCIAAKVPEAVKLAKRAIEQGKCVVIGLQSTGEARTLDQLDQGDGELTGFVSTAKGVIETLMQRHFPVPTASEAGINWSLFDNDPTLPGNTRKRKRGEKRAPTFDEEEFSSDSDDSSDGPNNSDSAVESSSDDESSGKEGSRESPKSDLVKGDDDNEDDDDDSDEDTSEDSDDDDEMDADLNPFGSDEPWLKKTKGGGKEKGKKQKASENKKNFSIKPPPTSRVRDSKTKTGFNSKKLKFEPVKSPMDTLVPKPSTVEAAKALSQRRNSVQSASSSGGGTGMDPSLLAIMSTSAQTTGSQSALRTVTVRKMKEELMKKLEILGPKLPANTLDELIDELGGPSHVAEMTGRRGRVVSQSNGSIHYQLRSESDVSLEMLNVAEKQRFMDGEKYIAIISEAASSGISLQADRRVKNHKTRVHITLELPWSADKAIQQFGRTHRSNQVSAPEYMFLISELAGEQRFASIVAKRLESLGALTHGDRRATESRDLSKYNVDTKYGRTALETTLKSILGVEKPLVKSEVYNEDFFDKCRTALVGVDLLTKDSNGLLGVEKEATNISRFLNRILGLPVKLQNQLFSYFSDTLATIIQQAKKMGRWDGGILDFGASGEHVEIVESEEFVGDPAFGTATTQIHKIYVERGMSFSEAMQKLNTDYCPGEGFYLSKRVRNEKQVAILVKISEPSSKYFLVYRPNTGLQAKTEKLSDLTKKYIKADEPEAEKWWNHQYDTSLSVCVHAFWQGKCRLKVGGAGICEVGLRRRTYHVLSGSVLGVWTHVEGVFARHTGHNNRMQIARVRANKRLVGILIPTACVPDMRATLTRVAQQAAGSSDN
eukprot:Em0015g1049a